jgi:hypothetical protein
MREGVFSRPSVLHFHMKRSGQMPALNLKPLFILSVLNILLLTVASTTAHAASPTIAVYRVGNSGLDSGASAFRAFEAKGFSVILVQGETTIEKHVEKVNIVNRSPAKVFIAFQFVPSEKIRRITVAKTLSKKGNGNFLTIDEVPGKFTDESNKLAYAIADSFAVKVKQMPLFPLLGINMPGIFLRLEAKESDLPDFVSKLSVSIDKFMKKERNL